MISKDMRISEVFRRHPRAAPVLIAHGICDCCGGHFTLEESAAMRGIELNSLLRRLEEVASRQ